jgi:arsenate reductase
LATTVIIYHNPKCSKSRETLELLRTRGVEPQVIEYLKSPPSPAELRRLLGQLGLEPRQLLRAKEAAEAGLDDQALVGDRLIEAMCAHPRTIERPIVVVGDRAALGRPPEAVLAILA